MLPSHRNSTPSAETEKTVSPVSHPELPQTSPLSQFSSQSFVYVAHAILIVAALGIVNWLHSTSSVSSPLKLQLAERWIDWQVARD
jgi:hypothetical protein